MISDDLIDEITARLYAGEDVRAVEQRYGDISGVRMAIFTLNEGCRAVYSDEQLLERIEAPRFNES